MEVEAPACQPARAESRAPRFVPPAGACDAHLHIFSGEARHGFSDARSYTPPPAPVAALDRLHARLGIARAVIVHAGVYRDHAVTLAALRGAPDRLRGVAVLKGDASAEEIRALHEAGFRGVRVNLFQRGGAQVYRGGAGFADLEALAPRLRPLGWHVQAWLDADDLGGWSERLLRLGMPVVVDHMGRITTDRGVESPGFATLCRLLAAGDVWCKLSGADRISVAGAPYEDAVPYGRALVQANPQQVVWGTDWPHVNYAEAARVPDDGVLTDLIPHYAPDAASQRLLLVDNPARLYGFA